MTDPLMITICWCFNDAGQEALAVRTAGRTMTISPCPVAGHPGCVKIDVIDASGETPLAGAIRGLIKWASEPHSCLPSPICEVCGREAGSPEQAMENAVMRGRLGHD